MSENQKHPVTLLFIYLGFLLAGFFIAQFLVSLALAPFLGNGLTQLGIIFSDPTAYPEYKNVILFIQGMNTLGGMVIATLLFSKKYYKDKILFTLRSPQEMYMFGAILSVIFCLPSITWIAEQNENMIFPAFMSDFEFWAKQKEAELKVLTEYITTFDSLGQFIFGMIVIAIIPAMGEELVFRGVFQPFFIEWTKNKHVGIWFAAILFSAIHFQFYGFFPRMLLGALFGYMYIWTGNIFVPMAGHFANNGFSLLLLHLKNQGMLKMEVETTAEMPISMLLGSFIIFCALVSMMFWHCHTNFKNYEIE
ncbi:MAG: CPBP family intramembrane metalloprotease [Cytophagales bacterium]|nr:MAG: CPBP family intramembrane metalloprotease [Cytophagales bacterium]